MGLIKIIKYIGAVLFPLLYILLIFIPVLDAKIGIYVSIILFIGFLIVICYLFYLLFTEGW